VNQICGRCGAENQTDARFCLQCGHELGALSSGSPGGFGSPAPVSPVPQTPATGPIAGTQVAAGDTAPLSSVPGSVTEGVPRPAPQAYAGLPAQVPAPTRRGTIGNPFAVVGWIVAVLAVAASLFLWISRQGLADRYEALQDRLEERSDDLAARAGEVEALQEERAELEGMFDVCQHASELGQGFMDAWMEVFSAGSRAEANQVFAELIVLSDDWQQALTECLAQ
jgi:hypothetical protein